MKRSLLKVSRRMLLGAVSTTLFVVAITVSVGQLTVEAAPLGCADYVCSVDFQCQRIAGCVACSGIRCSDVH
jgi:hypothetical protein